MASAYEESYHKVARVDELEDGKPRVFRAAGATLVLRRTAEGVAAIDGSCLADESGMSPELRLRRILECVASGAGSSSSDWQSLEARAGLPARVEDGDVWVCIDACRQ